MSTLSTISVFEIYVPRLMADLNLTDYQAAAVLGNAAWECSGFHDLVQGDNSGYNNSSVGIGWLQWTGGRHTTYMNYCSAKGLDWQSDEANYGYIVYEMLHGDYPSGGSEWGSGSLAGFRATSTIDTTTSLSNAVWYIDKLYERPADANGHLLDRYNFAQSALDTYRGQSSSPDLDARNDSGFEATLSVPSVVRGTSVTITYRLSNWGPGDNTNGSTTGIYLSTNNAFDANDILLTTDTVGALADLVGTTRTVTISTSNIAAGNYYIFAVANYNHAISEVTETNNPSNGVALTVTGGTGGNHAPVANADSYSTSFNTALTRTAATGVLANDTDQDGNTLTAILLANPSHGSLTFSANGSFTYTPTAGYSGTDSFTYFDSDGSTTSNNATVSLTVGGPANHAPVANADSYSTSFNTALTRTAATGVLANDTDQDGDPLTAILLTNPSHGSLTFSANGSFTYTPTTGYSGTDSFTYFDSDGSTTSNNATVSLTVGGGPTNHAPVANADSYSTSFNTPLTISGPGVLANDTDQDGNNVRVASIGAVPAHGTLQAFTDGSFTYTPTSTYSGPDSFTYFVTDGTLTSVSAATVSITVGPGGSGTTNHAPVANSDSYTTSFNTALTISGPGVLTNDTDQDGNNVSVASIGAVPAHGTLQAFTDGSFTYTPTSTYSGPDSFTYFVTDGTLTSVSAATVSITVGPGGSGSISINDVSITEGNSGTKIETFTVTRSGGTAAFDVNFTTSDDGARVADGDYVAKAGVLHFDANANIQTISVTINGDTKTESNETFFVNLTGATNGATMSDGQGLGSIANDDVTVRDFNGDAKSDILWRNDSGAVATWDMNDRSYSGAVLETTPNSWHIADTGDFNGDGKSDILWRNDSGAVATWDMNDRSYSGAVLETTPNSWHIAGTGDFNGDGRSDILWRNDSGAVATWDMNDRSYTGAVLETTPNSWHIAGTGDFNGDGKTGILWRNDSGAVATWDMNDRSYSGAVLETTPNSWHIAGTGDFNGDGKTDILWRNDSGAVATWDMNDRSYSGAVLETTPNSWHIAGTGDFNGDGKSDILWRNDSGAVATWDMNDHSYGGAVLETTPNDWHIV